MLQPAGLLAMDRLGVRSEIERLGHRITCLQGRTGAGHVIFDLTYDDLPGGLHALAVHRAALHDVLWKNCLESGAQITLNHDVTSAKDPVLSHADLIIDASGSRSALRQTITPKKQNQFAYGAVWASVPDIGITPGTLAQRYVAARVMLGYLPAGQQTENGPKMAALFWSLRPDQYAPWQTGFDAWRDQAIALWPELSPVIEGLTGPEMFTFATYHHFHTTQPWRGNVVLIGDAAHATSPQLGQGANQALIDAVVFSDALAQSATVEQAAALYAKTRAAHVVFYQRASWAMTRFFQSDHAALAIIRDLTFNPMKRVPWLHRQMLYTLAGLKTGVFTAATPDAIVNGLRTP